MKVSFTFTEKKGMWCVWTTYCFSMLLCMFLFLSCSEEKVSVLSEDTDPDVIQIGAGLHLLTKATNERFELNDSIGIFMTKSLPDGTHDTLRASGNYQNNKLYRLTALPDSWTPEEKDYYPIDGSFLDFYAYYPYQDPAFIEGTKINLEVATDQSSYYQYTRSDFMTARSPEVYRKATKVHLDFYHRLSQITFVLKPGIGLTKEELKDAQISIINAITNATYDLAQTQDSISIAGYNRDDILPYGNWTEKDENSLEGYMAILVPQEINSATYIQLLIGSRRYTYKPSSPIHMNPGCSREFIITVNHSDLDIETQIHPWKNCGVINGNAEEELEEEFIVTMTTTTPDSIKLFVTNKDMIIVNWGDNTIDTNIFLHKYTDNAPSHIITFQGTDTALVEFNCYMQKITELNFSPNKALTRLMCDDNQLTLLNVSKNTALKDLTCGNNLLTKLDVSKNNNLTSLACSNNLLTDLNLSGNTILENLSCSYNKLTTLQLTQHQRLENLNCSNNVLTNINITGCDSLMWLYCPENRLTDLDLSQNLRLSELSCNNNQLQQLELSNKARLHNINCENNQLQSLTINNNPKLYSINCENNKIQSLDISNNPQLYSINCKNNSLLNLDFSTTPNIRTIDCQNNPFVENNSSLTAVVNTLPDLSSIYQYGNITIENPAMKEIIDPICQPKNWSVN